MIPPFATIEPAAGHTITFRVSEFVDTWLFAFCSCQHWSQLHDDFEFLLRFGEQHARIATGETSPSRPPESL